MGDRAVIHVKGAPCAAYVHWAGSDALELIEKAVPAMRSGDDSYSQARLIGVLHTEIPGRTGLGVLPPPSDPPTEDDSQGDAGVLVYDCEKGGMTAYHGYLARPEGDDEGSDEGPREYPMPAPPNH